MPLMCVQCAMRAMLRDQPVHMFEETNEEHMRREHPDPVATKKERIMLERLLAEKYPEALKGKKV